MYKRRQPFHHYIHDPVTKSYHQFLTGSKTGEDGLIYKESIFPSHPSSIWTKVEKRPAPWDLVVADDRPDSKGVHSLMYLVRKVINKNLETISLESLQLTPYDPFGIWIWTDAVATRKDTLHLWTLFASAYPGSPEITNRSYNLLSPSDEHSHLPQLITTLTYGSPQGGWLVKLRFSITPGIGDSDLRRLPELGNLQVLQIVAAGGGEVDDGVVRSWCRASVQSSRFSKLRRLELVGCGRLTRNVLVYTMWVPRLRWLMLGGWMGGGVEGTGWVWVGEERWKRDRREWKKEEGERMPRVKITLGVWNKTGERVDRFVRRRKEVEEGGVKRKAGEKEEKKEKKEKKTVVRRKRLKDMGDLLAEFQNPKKR